MRKHPIIVGILCICFIGFIFLVCMWAAGSMGFFDTSMVGSGDKVAVIEVEGIITKSRPVIEKLKRYKESSSVKAIVVRINSPGGGVGPSQEIYSEILKLKDSKTIVASMGSVAASGGYYIACAAHSIYANPGTITGSIGVIIEFANIEELLGKIGLKSVVIKSGKYKDILSPTRTAKQEEKELIQRVIDNIHGQFIDAIAAGRSLEREKVTAIADGRIFSGEQALEAGLVDELGTLEDAIEAAARLAGIEGEPNVIYPQKKRPSIWQFFVEESLAKIRERLTEETFRADFMLSDPRFTVQE